MQKRKLRNNTILFILLCFLIPAPLFSKDGADHSLDMLAVLGLYSKTRSNSSASNSNKNKLQSLFSTINDYIDKPNLVGYEGVTDNYYDEIKKNHNFAYEQKYTHRELYHWGFDFDTDLTTEGIPTDYQIPNALRSTFIKWNGDDAVSDWYRFLKDLKNEQKKRNEALTNSVKETFGLSYSTDARDIAAILYYTHLLGDHIEHEGLNSGEAVLELDKIVYNVDTHMSSIAQINNTSLYNEYRKKINKLPKGDDRQYAQGVLDTVSIYLPRILRNRFSSEFASKNLIFVF